MCGIISTSIHYRTQDSSGTYWQLPPHIYDTSDFGNILCRPWFPCYGWILVVPVKFYRLGQILCSAHPSRFLLWQLGYPEGTQLAQFQLAEITAGKHKTFLTESNHSCVTSKIISHWFILRKVGDFGIPLKTAQRISQAPFQIPGNLIHQPKWI